MNMKQWLCLVLAMLLALSAAALAETESAEDLQAQLDAANARIAELEAEVEKYRPFYDKQIIAEYGEDGIVWLEDAQAQYDEAAQMYAQYGIKMDAYATQIKQSIVENLVKQGVLAAKGTELGIAELDEATRDDLAAKAAEDFETYVGYYKSYFAKEDATDEEAHDATVKGLADAGITEEAILEGRINDYIDEKIHDYVTKDVAVTDEDIRAEYDKMVADDEKSFAESDFDYNTARSDGSVIAWNPEGYRTVKHVLVKFNDDQAAQYKDLKSTLDSLNDELAALDEAEEKVEAGEDAEEAGEEAAEETAEEAAEETAEENGEEAAEETAEEAAEETAEESAEETAEESAEETAEETETPRTREEIQADIGEVGVAIEALYSELVPKAQEVIDAFNAGTGIDELIGKYGEDPGMTQEPAASQGYAVAENSTYWEPAFTEGAMSIAEAGQISDMVRGSNGIHIIYYLGDITPGAVPFEDIKDEVEAQALEDKIEETYNAQVDAWVEEASPVYHLDRF